MKLPLFLTLSGALWLASGQLVPTIAQSGSPRLRVVRPPSQSPSQALVQVARAPQPAPVVWQSTTRSLTEDTTIEARFPVRMVDVWGDRESVEQQDSRRPLTITPPLQGRWTWRSSESGVFVPSEEPERGRTYTFALRDGLVDAFGKPLPHPQPDFTLKAAGLRLIDRHPRWYHSGDLRRLPRLILQFNDAVNPAAAARQIHFVNDSGRKVQASARIATFGDLPKGWHLTPAFRQAALRVAGAADTATAPEPALALPGTLIVVPVQPLPAGKQWRLELKDVRSADGKTSLDETQYVAIGDIDPLGVSYAVEENDVGLPKVIRVGFNKELAPDVSAQDVLDRVKLHPQPEGYAAALENRVITLSGNFQHRTDYTLTLDAGLTAADGLAMPAPYTKSFMFNVLPPVVALPGFSVNQLSQGRSIFDVHTVNLSRIRVRAKVADRDSLIYALRAYRHFQHPDEGDGSTGEYGGLQRIPFDAMPGQKIFEQEFSGTAAIDDQDEFVIDWRQALNGRKAGALFVSVEGQARPEWQGKERRFGAQAFVQLTDIGLAWKLSADEVFVSLFSQATGKPLDGVTLTAYDAERVEMARATTAGDGTARLPRTGASWLLAETAQDLHAIEIDGPGADTFSMWRFGVPYDWAPQTGMKRQVTVFTERPVYQPGHTVYYKAVSRVIDTKGVRKPPAAEAGVLKVFDSKGRLIQRSDVRFSDTGSLDGSLEIPPGPLGHYRLEIELPRSIDGVPAGRVAASDEQDDAEEGEEESDGGNAVATIAFRTSFMVEEYKPNTFQTTFDDSSFALEDEKASISLQSRYLLGKPLGKARLAWTANVSRGGFQSGSFPQHAFLDSRDTYYWDADGYNEVPPDETDSHIVTAQARTDLSEDGKATLEFAVPGAPFVEFPRSVSLTAEVTDLNQQTITESWQRTFHPSAYYLGLRRHDGMIGAGEAVDIGLAAARTDGEPWPETVEARVTVEKIDFVTVRVQTVGGGSNVWTEAQRGVVAESTVTVPPGRHEEAAFTWSPEEPGFYYITARSTDPDGRAVASVTSVQVHGQGWASWNERDGVHIDVTPDKTSYQEGETARLLVKSPMAGRALVTIERRHIFRHFFTDITSNAQVIEVPLTPDLAPNAFVSVFIVRGADASTRRHKSTDCKIGFTELRVTDARSRLAVTVESGDPAYRPGDQGYATATVTDQLGAPVAGAEVTLWAADDGVLTLLPYQIPDLWSAFHKPQALAVLTGTSLISLLPEDPRELAFTNKGYMIGGGDGEGEGQASERLRRNFQPVAFFHGSLFTDDAGKVRVPFTVPDNLTRFRLIAVAAAGDNAFGSGEGRFEVNKPLMLEPALPRFANVGDRVTAKAVVLNHTDQAFETEVTLTLDSLATTSQPLVKRLALEPHGSGAVAFPLEFTEAGSAVWQWKAVSVTPGHALADSVQSTLAVGYAQPVLSEMRYALLKPGAEPANLLATVDPELLQGRGEVTVTLSNSLLLEATGAFAYLLQYPYGCVEQTTSSMMPWLALHTLGDPEPWTRRSKADVAQAIQHGASRLLSMQTAGGGLGYWPGASQPTHWASAYGGMALALARKAGAQVPDERLAWLASYLSESLRNAAETTDPAALYDRAFACYTLALLERTEPAYHDVLARNSRFLTHPARALLALAILESGGERDQAVTLLDDPLSETLESWHHGIFGSRLTALNLLVWSKIDPAHPTTAALVDRLINERKPHGHWSNTFDNAWGLMALAHASQSFDSRIGETSLDVAFAGHTATIALPAAPTARSITLEFDGQESARRLTISSPPAGLIRAVVTVRARPKLLPLEPRNEGFALTRQYAKVLPDGRTTSTDNLEVGDLVAVTLDLRVPKPEQYLAIDDPLPAILEAINPNFTSQAQVAAATPPNQDPDIINPWWSSHQELRQDRALFFADNVWRAGRYRLSYLTRVVAEGEVTAPPAKVEAMYAPDQYGLSGTQRLSARTAAETIAEQK